MRPGSKGKPCKQEMWMLYAAKTGYLTIPFPNYGSYAIKIAYLTLFI
jgi:hypothetical protein